MSVIKEYVALRAMREGVRVHQGKIAIRLFQKWKSQYTEETKAFVYDITNFLLDHEHFVQFEHWVKKGFP